MTDVAALVRSFGGMAQKRQLVRLGARDLDLTRAVRSGEVHRVRNGWYCTMDQRSAEVRAVRVGGRLTGMSAVIALGGWALDAHPLHVSVPANAARLRTQHNRYKRLDVRAPRGVALHWDNPGVSERGTAVSVGLVDALERVVLDEDLETAIAALDWALHTGALDRIDCETLILRLPSERRGIASWVDANCESLPESLSRTRLRLAGHAVVSQVRIAREQRIDLVVDEIVGLEVDGEEFHLNRFYEDRSKDIDITLSRLHAIRPPARTVFYDWDRLARAIDTAIAERRNSSAHLGNSGNQSRAPLRTRGLTGWRRRPPRRLPEFSKGGGNRAGRAPG